MAVYNKMTNSYNLARISLSEPNAYGEWLGEDGPDMVKITFQSSELYEFFRKMLKFREMGSGTPDEKELFAGWLKTKLKELDNVAIKEMEG